MLTLKRCWHPLRLSSSDLGTVELGGSFSYQRAFQRTLRMEEAFGQAAFYDVATAKVSVSELWTGGPSSPAAFAPLLSPVPAGRRPGVASPPDGAVPAMGQPAVFPVQGRLGRADAMVKNESGVLTRLLSPATLALYRSGGPRRRPARPHAIGAGNVSFSGRSWPIARQGGRVVPEFIPTAPQDPFDGKPLRMKKTDRGLVLYSIGPDMTDNGGVQFDPATKTGDIAFLVRGKDSQARSTRD